MTRTLVFTISIDTDTRKVTAMDMTEGTTGRTEYLAEWEDETITPHEAAAAIRYELENI